MNLALLFLAAQLVAPSAKVSWDVQDGAKAYNLYQAPLVTDASGNDSCGTWRKLGNTGGLWFIAKNLVSGQSYCFAVTQVHVETGVDAVTGLAVTVISESDKSDVTVLAVP